MGMQFVLGRKEIIPEFLWENCMQCGQLEDQGADGRQH
jgi:hypothetical protein